MAYRLTAIALALLFLAACSSGSETTPTADPAQTAPTVAGATTIPRLTAPTSAAPETTAAPTTTVAAIKKANANVASQSEIASVLAANGVENANRWAVEVVEYRPYPTNDPSFTKLKQNLAKYNPSPATLELIVASLSL